MTKSAKIEMRVGGKTVSISNPDKVYYPETGFTKGDVVSYYRAVAPALMPHLKGRPLTLKRYVDGVQGDFFYEKRCPPHRPEWVRTVAVRRKRDGKDIDFCVVENQATLLWAANLASIELHTGLAKARALRRPNFLVFDLDPGPPADVLDCAHVAVELKKSLEAVGLESFCKTSGSKGLQLFVPLNSAVTFDDTRTYAHSLARTLEEAHPEEIVTEMKKELRTGKVFIDWSQNAEQKTTVCVYSLRAREHPTVSTPVSWREITSALRKDDAESLVFEAKEVLKRIDKNGDLFKPVVAKKQKLPV
ncbi:MAG TPA: non-homologous end-joining DNA ligase [Actinomycetota bacterium]|nr:non-homologous end-joining DNA ligase [Actinomycetota bacterium]